MPKTIHQRAMLVSLRLSKWSATKYDKKISADVAALHNADADAGRYNKRLIPKGKNSYADLMTAFAAIYAEHCNQTLPWSDEGWRLLPMPNHTKYTTMIREHRAKIDVLRDAFIADYPTIREDVRRRVNGLFNPTDWPEPVDLVKRFTVAVSFNPIPASDDFRVELDSTTLADIARDTEQRVTRAVQDAQRNAVERLHDCVHKISERLNDPEAIFRDSLIDNARELTDVLTRLNVMDDPRIETLRRRVEELASVSPEALRTLPFQRKTTATEADDILAAMQSAFGTVNHD